VAEGAGFVKWLAWGSCGLTTAFISTAVVLPDSESGDLPSLVASLVFIGAFALVGALVASRLPGNPIGWIMCVAGLAYGVGGAAVTYLDWTGEDSTLAAWVSSWVWIAGIGPVMTFLLLLFPNGRLPSPRWRPVAIAAAAGMVLLVGGIALTPGPFEDLTIENPLGVPGAGTAADIGLIVLLLSIAASIASLVSRYRHGAYEERQQLKWLTYAAVLVGLAIASLVPIEAVATFDTTELSNTVVTGSIAVVPVAIGIAILRHGLWDIDLVIRRTLVYATLTASLAVAYLGAVLLLQLALGPLTEDNGLAVAGSTLAVAVLFRPVRTRIQTTVDRRFYRRRYDAERTIERFGARLRDEVELDALASDLRHVVSDTMQPAHVSIWLRRAT
jgi:hypothetical protein